MEESILELQEKKRLLTGGAFGDKAAKNAFNKMGLDDLRLLFNK